MTEKEKHLKAASLAKIIGIGGALGVMLLAAWASYVVRGEVSVLVLLAAGFGAVFHLIGCMLFVNHFKSLAAAEDKADDA